MIELYNDILCVSVRWLAGSKEDPYSGKVISYYQYRNYVQRGKIEVIRQGKGKGRYALVSYESLPGAVQERIRELIGDPYDWYKYRYFEKYYKEDDDARRYYAGYRLSDGRYLSEIYDKRRGAYYSQVYYQNAKMLNAVGRFYADLRGRWKSIGGSHPNIWGNLSEIVNYYRGIKGYEHWLPSKARPLARKWREYSKQGYEALISGKFQNQNARKVDERLEKLLLSLWVMKGKPYASWIWKYYQEFLRGEIDIIDVETGEVFSRDGFVEISMSEVWRVLNRLDNRASGYIERNKGDRKETSRYRPHVMRRDPDYSLSMITIDDFDLPIFTVSGNHPKCYFAFDVKSQAIIGWTVREDRKPDIVVEMFRNMFHNLLRWGVPGVPVELQLEHFNMSRYKGVLEQVFPMVRFANPGNPQEKRVERLLGQFKYEVIKRVSNYDVGRHYARREANRVPNRDYWDERGISIGKERRYKMDEVRSLVRDYVERWNSGSHPKYEGHSRKDVLLNTMRTDLVEYPMHVLAKYFGFKAQTERLRRHQYVKVFGREYWLEYPELLSKLEGDKVEVYYLPYEEELGTVYIWQGDKYIGRGLYKERFNIAESEGDDNEAKNSQLGWIRRWDSQIKQKREGLTKVAVIENKELEVHEYEVIEEKEEASEDIYKEVDIRRKALESL